MPVSCSEPVPRRPGAPRMRLNAPGVALGASTPSEKRSAAQWGTHGVSLGLRTSPQP